MADRTIKAEFWVDPWVQELTPEAKLLFLYLWTNSHVSAAGAYQISEKTIAFETGLNIGLVSALWAELSNKVYRDHKNHIIWIKNFLRYQTRSPKFLIAVAKALTNLPAEIIKMVLEYNNTLLIPYEYPIGQLSKEQSSKAKSSKERASTLRTLSTYRSEPVDNSKEQKNAADSNESKSKNNSEADIDCTAVVVGGNGKAESKYTSVIAEKTIRSVTAQATSILKTRGYWNGSKACEERLGRFVSKLETEASTKKNPAGWLVKVIKLRLIEQLDDFKPPRVEMEKAT